jgi:hypothetical protein
VPCYWLQEQWDKAHLFISMTLERLFHQGCAFVRSKEFGTEQKYNEIRLVQVLVHLLKAIFPDLQIAF